jgi:UDP-N-acetylglucosamine acyltransferase
MGVHPTAVVADGAELGEGVVVGPYCVIGPRVVLGSGCRLHSHVIIDGDTHLGEESVVYPHAVIGTTPQDKKLGDGEITSTLRIGSHNQIREFVTIHGGTEFGDGTTAIGSHNMLLVGCHIGHDATVGDGVIVTNGAMAAGHTTIEDHAILGAMVGVHQFARVGKYAMIGAGAMLSKDAPPFALVQGDRARLISVNAVGLKRAGFENSAIVDIKRAYRKLFWRGGTLSERLASVTDLAAADTLVRDIVEFIEHSKRGLVMPRGRHDLHEDKAPSDP